MVNKYIQLNEEISFLLRYVAEGERKEDQSQTGKLNIKWEWYSNHHRQRKTTTLIVYGC